MFAFEWLVYLVHPLWNWPTLPLQNMMSTRLLLVGDPQLLGNINSAWGPFGYIERWDADRFIAKTFDLVHSRFKPDVTIFLGDIFDEGELATNRDFRSYVERLLGTFSSLDLKKTVFLPGDNDIGGEGNEPGKDLTRRFNSYFRNDSVISYRQLDFIKVNYLTTSYAYRSHLLRLGHNLRIILSHVPLSSSFGSYPKNVLHEVRPELMLSGHDHKSVHRVADRATGALEKLELDVTLDRKALRLNLSDGKIHEIQVPSCSYRMGTLKVGFGALIIDPDRIATYAVLWSPQRLVHLAGYLAVLVLLWLLLPFKLIQGGSGSCLFLSWKSVERARPSMLTPA